jgi:hypothetical protein
MNQKIKQAAALTAVIPAVLLAAACGPSHAGATASDKASARAAASAIATSPQYLADKKRLENELTANFQKNFNPAHPVKSTEAAIAATFPNGDTHKIEAYAVKTFTPAVGTTKGPGSARENWVNGVVVYALNQGAAASASATP